MKTRPTWRIARFSMRRAGLGARVDVQDLDAVVAGAEAVEVLAAHRRELLGGVVVVRAAVQRARDVRAAGRAGAGVARAHALLPIQKIPNIRAPMPTTQMTRPSADRADAADAGAARVGLLLDGLDVVDDRALLVGGELVVTEDRHVLRAGQHRRVDLEVVGVLQARRGLARGERAALADEVVAGRAVEPEQLAALGQVAVAQVAGGERRAAAVGLDVGHQLVDLLVGEDRAACRARRPPGGPAACGRCAPGSRPPPRRRRSATGRGLRHALEVRAVAGDAAAARTARGRPPRRRTPWCRRRPGPARTPSTGRRSAPGRPSGRRRWPADGAAWSGGGRGPGGPGRRRRSHRRRAGPRTAGSWWTPVP